MSLHLSMLGAFEVARAGNVVRDFRTQTARLLLAYLALESDRSHEREHLAGLFWPDAPPDQALTNLRQTLHRLRQSLEPDGAEGTILLISRQMVQLNPRTIDYLDIAAFSAAIAATHRHRHRAAYGCSICVRQLRAAVGLYRGELLAGFKIGENQLIDEWLLHHRERLHAELTFALETLALHEQRRGDYHQAAGYLRRWLAQEPWCEDAHYLLMQVLDAAGRHSAALRQFMRCRAALADEMGIEPTERTFRLAEQIRRRGPHVAQRPAGGGRVHAPTQARLRNAPRSNSPFVGRRHELDQLAERLADPYCRLITIIGPGGCGKTRLAIEAASTEAYIFAGGAIYVSLASIDQGDQIYDALAAALGLPTSPGYSIQGQVCEQLRDAELLVVMDNCEQIVGADVAISRLLAAVPNLTVLATSRAPLHVRAEWRLPIAGLTFPPIFAAPPAASYDAGQLFLQLMHQARDDGSAQDEDPALIAECCRLLYGKPLALELAAFQLQRCSLAEIVAELRRCLTGLATTMPDVPVRHRSMRVVFEWSWGLLAENARRDLARLSIFRGSFTLAAAGAVLNDDEQPALFVAEALDTLAHWSLLHREQHGRYTLHELVRQFAEEHLDAAEATIARTRHAVFYLDRVAERAPALYGHTAMAAEAAIRVDIDNLYAAWEWALSAGRLDLIARSMHGLLRFLQRTNTNEGARIFAGAVGRIRGGPAAAEAPATRWILSELLCCQVTFLIALARLEEARAAAVEALALAEGHPLLVAASRLWCGEVLLNRRDLATAELHLSDAAAMAAVLSDDPDDLTRARLIWSHSMRLLGYIDHLRGNYPAALARYRVSRQAYRDLENPRYESHALLLSAETQRCVGDYASAKAGYEQALDLVRGTGNLDLEHLLFNNLGDVMIHLGRYDQAEACLGEALALARRTCNHVAEARACEGLSRAALHRGDHDLAETYARRALNGADQNDRGWYLTTLAKTLEAQGRLGEAAETYAEAARRSP